MELLRFTCGAAELRVVLVELLRFTCGVAVLRVVLVELLRFTCGVAELRVVLVELLRFTCGVAELRVVLVELLRFTCGVAELRLALWSRFIVGAEVLLERETAADWLLLLVLPPCERLRPWAIASDAPKMRHPMSAKLIMNFVTEVFIIVEY